MRRLLVLALIAPLAACGGSSDEERVTVFAAASLTSTFTELGKEFEAAHDGVSVKLSFGGSSDLAQQIQEGAPADVFASADAATMARVAERISSVHTFATNTLEIAVPPGNPDDISSVADLAQPGVSVVVCAPAVPCGAASEQVARAAGVTLSPVSEEQSVTDVLGKVISGEADAGLVYRTDVLAAGTDVEGIPFAEADQAVNSDQMGAVVRDDGSFDLATQFVDFVLGTDGQRVLEDAGFGKP
jgi:molybdate transport system substrate-binding protein